MCCSTQKRLDLKQIAEPMSVRQPKVGEFTYIAERMSVRHAKVGEFTQMAELMSDRHAIGAIYVRAERMPVTCSCSGVWPIFKEL
ncbi:hypothetical protein BK120_26550 [Paenibacillus sp. FSL A5-0031]|nr:hypothetical protein BK120_26550 [Paenibacillus sp. FSL A5-0031]